MWSRLVTLAAVSPYLGALLFVTLWQSGADWAKWPLLMILLAVGMVAVAHIVRRKPRPRPSNYVGRFRRQDGAIIHVARMASGKLWAASDTHPPVEIGYVDGRELMRWEKLATTPDG